MLDLLSPRVRRALEEGTPLVALESALITHGLPYPQNLETALAMEAVIEEEGATPATMGIIGGRVKVGLSSREMERLARGGEKVSLRDLPLALSSGWDGGTTVAATLHLAYRNGIKVFATGGIGGVHPGRSDISADLFQLSQTPMVVISSGAKAVLDLPATWEWLETYGVPVIGYGTDELPAFYSPTSGLPLPLRVDTPEEVAAIARARDELGTKAALLVAVPVPEADEVPPEAVKEAIVRAEEVAKSQGIRGPALTPFLLAQLNELTGGATLRANCSLLVNNARVAARIARAMVAPQG